MFRDNFWLSFVLRAPRPSGHPTSNMGSDTGLRQSQAQHSSLQFSARSFSSMAASFSFAGLVSEIANRQPGMMMLISLGISP